MKLFRYISICIIIIEVIFINLNEVTPAWDLVYNAQQYLIVSSFIYLGWFICKDVLTRSLLIAVGFYYSFEVCMDVYHIINPIKYEEIYTVSNVNYILGVCLILMLISYPLLTKFKTFSHG